MFTTLLESGRADRWRPAHPAHPMLSLATHAVAIATLAGTSGAGVAPRDVPPERVTYTVPRFRVIAEPPATTPAADPAPSRAVVPARAVRLRTPREVPDGLPPVPDVGVIVPAVAVITDVDDALGPSNVGPSADELRSGAGDGVLAGILKGYPALPGSAADIYERGLVPYENNPEPRYPAQLLWAEVEGAVLVAFVVDTTGRADPRSFEVLRSSNELFTRAVRRVLPRLRFRPAQSGATKVAILVEQQFVFALRQ